MLSAERGAVLLTADPRAGVLLGWLAIWGWAGLIAHGVLWSRLEPGATGWTGFALHVLSLAAGAVAIASRSESAARLAGALLVATALSLMVVALRGRRGLGAGDA